MPKYHKLVRDRIPEIIEASGKLCVTETLSDKDYLKMVDAKLDEELSEYHQDQNIEELADLMEVIRAAAVARGYTLDDLERVRAEKAAKRGAFEKKILLKAVEDNTGTETLVHFILHNQSAILNRIDIQMLDTYIWIQENFQCRNVETDAEFQSIYSKYYGMLRFTSAGYRNEYFCLLEHLKKKDMSFEELSQKLYSVDKRHELSFISKMMHTADTSKPIFDSRVKNVLELPHAYYGNLSAKIARDQTTLNKIAKAYEILLQDEGIQEMLKEMDKKIPGKHISKAKKLDFILWSIKDRSRF